MKFFAIPQPTASWLLGQGALLPALPDVLWRAHDLDPLAGAEVILGPLRIAGSPDGRVVGLWNADYLSGTGEESWGFIRVASPLGLFDIPDISREVLERALYVISQRLQGLMLDTALIHRKWDDNAHTCLAGRGTKARHFNICYVEREIQVGTVRQKSILCVGPEHDFDRLRAQVADDASHLSAFVRFANDMIVPARRRPVLDSDLLTPLSAAYTPTDSDTPSLADVTIPTGDVRQLSRDPYRTLAWTYDDWLAAGSPLSSTQRRILESDSLLSHPVRIVGPAGSGKTLLMQLLAIRRLRNAADAGSPLRVLYVVHNAAMASAVRDRFSHLGASPFLDEHAPQTLTVTTLADYGTRELGLPVTSLIDPDAHEAKLYQLQEVGAALHDVLDEVPPEEGTPLLNQVRRDPNLMTLFSLLIMAEISIAIKGHGLVAEPKRYRDSERRLSRLHGVLTQRERELVFEVFRRYHKAVFEEMEVLDSDDIALSLLGRLRTPIWELKRRAAGFDFVFVDEAQLFNENEKRLFALITKQQAPYVPIVLALDDTQEVYGQTSAGLGALGIESIANESLTSSQRSSRQIIDLAFFVIQRTTDLFGSDFPDFTGSRMVYVPADHPLVRVPRIEVMTSESAGLGKFVLRRIRELRKNNLRQIAVICHAESYWPELETVLKASDLDVQILLKRGEKLNPSQPLVALTRPAYVGGQEFDAVIAVGLEQGVVPLRIRDNEALAAAVEQQALREMYLSFTRARYQLLVILSLNSKPSAILQEAVDAKLLSSGS